MIATTAECVIVVITDPVVKVPAAVMIAITVKAVEDAMTVVIAKTALTVPIAPIAPIV